MSRCHVFQNNVISWHEEQKSKFMWTRDLFIAACEEARAIDWDATRNKFAEKKELGQRVKDFTKATRTYRKALEKAPSQMGAPQKLTHFFNQMYEHYADQNQESWEPDLQDGMTSGLTNRNPLAALDALAEFFDGWDDLGKGAFQYGMIGYYKMQRRLPDRQVVLAMVLADWFTFCRPDDEQVRSPDLPRVPNLSTNTPWDVIKLFVDAAFDEPSKSMDLQTRVKSAIDSGAWIGLQAG
jgi:hypothetical protein